MNARVPTGRQSPPFARVRHDWAAMSDSGELLGGLPRSRPRRRSTRRPRPVSVAVPDSDLAGAAARRARAQGTATSRARTDRTAPAASSPDPPAGRSPDPVEVITTAVRAAGELAEIGLTVGTQALRGALERLPRP